MYICQARTLQTTSNWTNEKWKMKDNTSEFIRRLSEEEKKYKNNNDNNVAYAQFYAWCWCKTTDVIYKLGSRIMSTDGKKSWEKQQQQQSMTNDLIFLNLTIIWHVWKQSLHSFYFAEPVFWGKDTLLNTKFNSSSGKKKQFQTECFVEKHHLKREKMNCGMRVFVMVVSWLV